jgi:outer membrane protein
MALNLIGLGRVCRNFIGVVTLAFGLTLFSGSVFAADIRIGTVDLQKALQSVEDGKQARSKLEREFTTRKEQLQSEESSIRKMGEEFKKQGAVLNDKAKAKKQSELQEKIMKFQELTARSQSEIQAKEQELLQPILGKLRGVVAELAKQRGYSIVLEKNENMVIYSQDKDDLTSEVIQQYNSRKGGA